MKIRKIEATKPVQKTLRVAAYARVSVYKDAMLRSLSAQVSHYSKYIQSRDNWQYAGVFTDEAASGTTGERSGFRQMLAECRAGKIDMVITKSVSRFARNTILTLETVRELREIGVDIFFERENMHTIGGDGEFLLTLLASFAQEESHAVSENCNWHIRKKYEAGELVGLRFMYGYTIEKGAITVNEEQAAVVRRIFSLYLDGSGITAIAKILQAENIPTLRGGAWTPYRVSQMLCNEKYAGNSLLQKKYTTDYLTKKPVRNKGEKPQYYVKDTHPAIIDEATFNAAQTKLQANREKYGSDGSYRNLYVFTGCITCGHCGKTYRRCLVCKKPWWICSTKYKDGNCQSKRIPEAMLIAASAEALGLPHFDESIFIEEVEAVTAAGNVLTFTFKNGKGVNIEWRHKSRRDSWTDEMKQKARIRGIKQRGE